MIANFSDYPSSSLGDIDICVIGAGAAGITIAKHLDGSGIRVLLLEGGEMEASKSSEKVYEGISDGYASLTATRLRFFGGTTNHWSGYCRAPRQIDLQQREWVPGSGWPIKYVEVANYIERAAKVVAVEPEFRVDYWAPRLKTTPLLFQTPGLDQHVSVLSPPVRFGEAYRNALERSDNVRAFYNANVTEIVPKPNGSEIRHVKVRSFNEDSVEISARYYIVACGGIESARLLLNSDSIIPAGLGNSSGMVGKYFSDHRKVRLGKAHINVGAEGIFRERHYEVGNNRVIPHLNLSEEACRAAKTGQCNIRLRRPTGGRLDQATEFLSRLLPWDATMREYSVIASAEPIPLEENRLELIPERDALGLRRIKLTYKPSPMEEKAWMAAADKLSSALGVAGMGRLKITYKREEEDSFDEWGNHHYGTTRMHASPNKGVVDGDLRVHGTHNLFVCSTSVYPIAGMMTPTLTLVALSLRLADKLKEELQSS